VAASASGIDVVRLRLRALGRRHGRRRRRYLSVAQIGFVEKWWPVTSSRSPASSMGAGPIGVLLATFFRRHRCCADPPAAAVSGVPYQFFVMLPYVLAVGALSSSRAARDCRPRGRPFTPPR
jgi:hypothetical protein